jgi:hypothetical protein
MDTFKLNIDENEFIRYMVLLLYENILNSCYQKSSFKEKKEKIFLRGISETQLRKGLIPWLAEGLATSNPFLFLQYKKPVITKVNNAEVTRLKQEYDKGKPIPIGTCYLNFSGYYLQNLILRELYRILFSAIGSSYTQTLVAGSTQIGFANARDLVRKDGESNIVESARQIAEAIKNAKPFWTDSQDTVSSLSKTLTSGATSASSTLDFVYSQIAYLMHVPTYFVTRILNSGGLVNYNNDEEAMEIGVNYWYEIVWNPIITQLFGDETDCTFNWSWKTRFTYFSDIIDKAETSTILAPYKEEISKLVIEGLGLKWDAKKYKEIDKEVGVNNPSNRKSIISDEDI